MPRGGRHRRREPLVDARRDGGGYSAGAGSPAGDGRADPSLQGLFDLRLLADDRKLRPRDGYRAARARKDHDSDRRRRPEACPLLAVWDAVRSPQRRRDGASHRPSPDDERASDDSDARSGHAPAHRRANEPVDRAPCCPAIARPAAEAAAALDARAREQSRFIADGHRR